MQIYSNFFVVRCEKNRTLHAGCPIAAGGPVAEIAGPYFLSSVSAALALSTAGPSVTLLKAAMAWGFISLAL